MAAVNESENHEKTKEKPHSMKAEKVDVGKLESEAEVGSEAAKIAAEVADLGIDSAESAEAAEGFSEGKGDKKDSSTPTKTQKKTQDEIKAHIHKAISQGKMRKSVEKEIRKEIRKKERKVLLAYAGFKKYSPHKLAEMIAQIRSLKELLSSLLNATKEILTGLYLKWVKKEI